MWNGNDLLWKFWNILPSPCVAEESLGNGDVLLHQTPPLRLSTPTLLSSLSLLQGDSHQFRVMAAVLRHCLLIVGPTEDKTEELHRWVTSADTSVKHTVHSCYHCVLTPQWSTPSVLVITVCVVLVVNTSTRKWTDSIESGRPEPCLCVKFMCCFCDCCVNSSEGLWHLYPTLKPRTTASQWLNSFRALLCPVLCGG